ncbi:beta-fructofuranosidase [Arthrobacter sp. CAN_A212]|uniref:glycoside hydrolase family 32 protein n=1 Tax=Arthrobacter sp. CAN_A212 TaxID=2787719 RepID=UPI0018CB767C
MTRLTTVTRPQFHFTSNGWINDPHAITYFRGRYHLFFQHVPGNTVWGLGCYWGHASGPDLFSLEEMAPALAPGDGDDGVWSGSLTIDAAGTPRIFYTSVSHEHPALGSVRTATPLDDGWVNWEKGPVVVGPSEQGDVVVYRDPTIVRTPEGWRMLVGAGFSDGSAGVLGYVSVDGERWEEDKVAIRRSGEEQFPLWSGSMWECPQIIEIDGQHALIVSVWDADILWDVVYALGTYADGAFVARTWGHLSYGPSPYAATTFRDAAGFPALMFWLREVSGSQWAGAHSIPYRITIENDVLVLDPHPDLVAYRTDAGHGSASDITWPATAEDFLELQQDGVTSLKIDRGPTHLTVSIRTQEFRFPWAGDIRIIVDGPVVEISSRAGVFAAPFPVLEGQWTYSGAEVIVFGLARG